MLVENNKLIEIDPNDVKDGIFTAPDEVLYIDSWVRCDNATKIILPNVIEIGDNFLNFNSKIEYLFMPKVEKIGKDFLYWNVNLLNINMPNIKEIGINFLFFNKNFQYTPNIIKVLKGELRIDTKEVDKKEYLRKYNLKKLLC